MPGLLVRALLGALVALAASVLATPVALAHDDLVSSTPAAGATVRKAPTEVSLTFSAAVGEQFAQVAVVDAAGTAYQNGPPAVSGATVAQRVDGLPAGVPLSINYRVVSSDGHPISGSVPFTVEAGAQPSATAEPTPIAEPAPTATATAQPTLIATPDATPEPVQPTADSGTGPGSAVWLLGGAAALALGGLAFWLARRRTPPPPA